MQICGTHCLCGSSDFCIENRNQHLIRTSKLCENYKKSKFSQSFNLINNIYSKNTTFGKI